MSCNLGWAVCTPELNTHYELRGPGKCNPSLFDVGHYFAMIRPRAKSTYENDISEFRVDKLEGAYLLSTP
jgi:hypothetical protein